MEFTESVRDGTDKGEDKEGDSEKGSEAHSYWKEFAKDPKKGMSFEEFRRGYRSAEPEVSDEEIFEAFSKVDSDKSKRLSWKEFQRLFREQRNVNLRHDHGDPPKDFDD